MLGFQKKQKGEKPMELVLLSWQYKKADLSGIATQEPDLSSLNVDLGSLDTGGSRMEK